MSNLTIREIEEIEYKRINKLYTIINFFVNDKDFFNKSGIYINTIIHNYNICLYTINNQILTDNKICDEFFTYFKLGEDLYLLNNEYNLINPTAIVSGRGYDDVYPNTYSECSAGNRRLSETIEKIYDYIKNYNDLNIELNKIQNDKKNKKEKIWVIIN